MEPPRCKGVHIGLDSEALLVWYWVNVEVNLEISAERENRTCCGGKPLSVQRIVLYRK